MRSLQGHGLAVYSRTQVLSTFVRGVVGTKVRIWWHRHSCLCAFRLESGAPDWASRAHQHLILRPVFPFVLLADH